MDSRVVVTGRGVISPLGVGWEQTRAQLLAGRSGVAKLEGFDTDGLDVRIGGQVSGFVAEDIIGRPLARRTSRSVRFGLAAATLAMRDAGLDLDQATAPRTGVLVGSVISPTAEILQTESELRASGPSGISPYVFATTGIVTAAGELALHLGAQGPTASMATACATGSTCLGEGMRLIRDGRADVVIAGGMDAFARFEIEVATRAGALSRRNDDPAAASRPFDRGRDGFVMSEGAGVLVLESAEHARNRGAHIHAEIAGYGATTDAAHLTAPRKDGSCAERAMRTALDSARSGVDDVDYINAHGTGTPLNDAKETEIIRRVYGDRAERVPVSSTKSMTGHMLAAGGAVEAALVTESVSCGVIPPTINCDDPDDTGMDFVTDGTRESRVNLAMSHSFGFGGHNAVLVVRAWPPRRDRADMST